MHACELGPGGKLGVGSSLGTAGPVARRRRVALGGGGGPSVGWREGVARPGWMVGAVAIPRCVGHLLWGVPQAGRLGAAGGGLCEACSAVSVEGALLGQWCALRRPPRKM